jgi:hypothetical protein
VILLNKWKKIALLPSILLAITACSNQMEHPTHQLANGDLQETTKSISVIPSFLTDKSKQIQQVYGLAAENTELLQWIPCYCGCGGSAGHTSSQNCFVKEIEQDGAVIWDDHGTRCGVCMEIAVYSVKLKQEGKSVKEIRDYIDNKYQKGYGKPTDTPLPEGSI